MDYRSFNRITKPNHTPNLRTDKMFDMLGQACFFFKLDFNTGFHQIRITASNIERTAFKTQ